MASDEALGGDIGAAGGGEEAGVGEAAGGRGESLETSDALGGDVGREYQPKHQKGMDRPLRPAAGRGLESRRSHGCLPFLSKVGARPWARRPDFQLIWLVTVAGLCRTLTGFAGPLVLSLVGRRVYMASAVADGYAHVFDHFSEVFTREIVGKVGRIIKAHAIRLPPNVTQNPTRPSWDVYVPPTFLFVGQMPFLIGEFAPIHEEEQGLVIRNRFR